MSDILPMKPKFIYFDLDNTLIDHSYAETMAHQATYKQYPELQKVTLSEWLKMYRRVNGKLWKLYQEGRIERFQVQYARFFESMHFLELPVEKSTEIGESYMGHYQDYWNWIDDAQEAFARISEKYETGIITNGFKETQLKKFQKLELFQYTDYFVVSEEIGKMKPHPAVFKHAEKIAGVPGESILYVGDSYSSDIIGGHSAGWKTAWYLFGDATADDNHEADFVFNEFTELERYLDR